MLFRSRAVLNHVLAPDGTDYSVAYEYSADLHLFDFQQLSDAERRILDAYVSYMETRVRITFGDHDNAGWTAVDALSAALLDRKVLSGAEALCIT